jgi:phage terminase small subunit
MPEKYELARPDYEAGMKYKDIAAKYDVTLNTVKSWKLRHWNKGATAQKSVHTKSKKVAHKIVEELSENGELTDKQKMFCLYYLQRFNAIWAYMKAYKVDYKTAHAHAYRMVANGGIQKQIATLRKSIASDLFLNATDVAREYAKQAFSDYGDYVDFGTKQVVVRDGWYKPVKDKLDGGYLTEDISYVHLKDDSQVDTSLIKQVSIGRDGIKLELYDKQKAQSELLKYLKGKDSGDAAEDKTVLVDDVGSEGVDEDNQNLTDD